MIVRELLFRLGMDVDQSGFRRGERGIGRVRRRADLATRSMRRFGRAARFAGAAFGVFGAAGVVRGLISSISEFEQLETVMVTLEQSTERAAQSQQFIVDFAKQTPFTIQQVTRAFQTFRALGMQPTTEMFTNLGNTASALGEDLESLVFAAQTAARGQVRNLERVLRTDVKTSGDTLEVIVDGQTRTIQKNTGAVLEFLRALGETRFAGGMERQLNTIAGRFSVLRDSIFLTTVSMGAGGFRGELVNSIDKLNDLVQGVGNAAGAGDRLATILRVLTDVFIFFAENIGTVTLALTVLTGARILRGMQALGIAVNASFAPFLVAAAAITTIVLAMEDLLAFFRGDRSVIGILIEELGPEFRAVGQDIKDFFVGIKDDIVEVWTTLVENVSQLMGRIVERGRAALQPILDLIDRVDRFLNPQADPGSPDSLIGQRGTPRVRMQQARQLGFSPEEAESLSSTFRGQERIREILNDINVTVNANPGLDEEELAELTANEVGQAVANTRDGMDGIMRMR